MRHSRFALVFLAALCCLLLSTQARAQHAYGYASISFDPGTGEVTGYASTELDYDTAYYYDSEVQAQIQDDNGTVYASGAADGGQMASVFLDVINAISCIRFTIISYVIASPRFDFLGCGGRYDPFGFSDFPFDYWWDYGDFFGRQERCVFNRLIFIASVIASVIECLPTHTQCQFNTDHVLPSGLDADELSRIPNINAAVRNDQITITCHSEDDLGNAQSGVNVNFGTDPNTVLDNGGHLLHTGRRPQGTYNHTLARSDGNGNATAVWTAPQFGGTTRLTMTVRGSNDTEFFDAYAQVPGLEELPDPVGNAGYIRTGSSEDGNTYHPNGHYVIHNAVGSLQAIAADFRDTFFPAANFPDGVPRESALKFNDSSLKFGGKFDITPNFRVGAAPSWQTGGSHDEHRVGINCDVSDSNIANDNVVIDNKTRNRWEVMEEIFCSHGSTRTNREHCFSHWHLRFEYGSNCTHTDSCARAALGESAPANGAAASVPGLIEAEAYDLDAQAGGSFAPPTVGAPPSGIVYAKPEILPMPSDDANRFVPAVGGEWMNYTVNIAASQTYTISARVASPYYGNTFHVEVDGVNKTGPIAIPYTGSGDTYQFVSVDNIWLDAGAHMMTVVVDSYGQSAGNFDYFAINPYYTPPSCHPTSAQLGACRHIGGIWDYDACYCDSSGGGCGGYYNCY